MILLCISKEIFADFAFGFNGYFNLNDRHESSKVFDWWSLGGSLGFGSMYGRPVILEILGGPLSWGDARVKLSLDWHALPWQLSDVVQLFLGFGAGGRFDFDPSLMFHEDGEIIKNIKPVIYGRIPIGLKFLISDFELFIHTIPQLGWDFQQSAFYWSFEVGSGFRIWF